MLPASAFSLDDDEEPSATARAEEAKAARLASNGSAGPSGSAETSLLVITVTDDGHVWQWDIGLESLPRAPVPLPIAPPPGWLPVSCGPMCQPAGKDGTGLRPELRGLLRMLPHSVTTLSPCPAPVFVDGAGCALGVIAAVTAAGSVELVTLQRGSLTPLAPTVSVSLSISLP